MLDKAASASSIDPKVAIVSSILNVCLSRFEHRYSEISCHINSLLESLVRTEVCLSFFAIADFVIQRSLRQYCKQNRSLSRELELAGHMDMAENKRVLSSIEKKICDKCATILQLATHKQFNILQGEGGQVDHRWNAYYEDLKMVLCDTKEASMFPSVQNRGSGFNEKVDVQSLTSRENGVMASRRKVGSECFQRHYHLIVLHCTQLEEVAESTPGVNDSPYRCGDATGIENSDTRANKRSRVDSGAIVPTEEDLALGRTNGCVPTSMIILSSSDSAVSTPNPHNQTPAQYWPSSSSTTTPEVSQRSIRSATSGDRSVATTSSLAGANDMEHHIVDVDLEVSGGDKQKEQPKILPDQKEEELEEETGQNELEGTLTEGDELAGSQCTDGGEVDAELKKPKISTATEASVFKQLAAQSLDGGERITTSDENSIAASTFPRLEMPEESSSSTILGVIRAANPDPDPDPPHGNKCTYPPTEDEKTLNCVLAAPVHRNHSGVIIESIIGDISMGTRSSTV